MNTPPTLNVGQSIRVGNSGYQIIKELGYGAFGRCYMVKNISTEYCYACKVMHLPSPTSRVLWKNLDNEVFILNLLRNCSNISKFISYHTDDKYTYIILGLYENNSLKEVIGEQGRLSEDQARVYLLQTLSGLFNCHKNKVLHRDIKPGNVLLNHKMEAILSDFGLAIILNSENQQVKGRCGTRYYMAPEVASGNSYGFSADIWSLGVMLLTLVVGYLPFCNSNDKNIYQKVKTNKFKFPHNIKLSEEFKDIVSKMLNLNPEERPTIAQIQDHPFFHISELEASSSNRISKISEYQLPLKESDSNPEILANGCHHGIINRTSDIYPHCISKIQILERMFINLKRFIIGDDLFNNCMFNNTPSYVLNASLIFVGRAIYLKNQKVLLYELNNKIQGALFIDNTNISYNPKNIKYQYTKANSGSNFSHTNNQVIYFCYNIPKNLSKKFEFFNKYRNEISKRIPSLMPTVKFKCFEESLIVTYFSIVLGNGVFILSTGEIQVTFKDKYKLLFSKGGNIFSFVDPLGIIITFNTAYIVNAATSVYFINQDERAITAYSYLIKAKVIFEHIIKNSDIGLCMNN